MLEGSPYGKSGGGPFDESSADRFWKQQPDRSQTRSAAGPGRSKHWNVHHLTPSRLQRESPTHPHVPCERRTDPAKPTRALTLQYWPFKNSKDWKKHHPQAENPLVFQDRDQEDGCPSVNPEENAEVQDEILRVRKGLELLGSDYRQVLILKEMEEMDYQTISELLDIPIGTVRSRLHRARQELRWILEQWDTRSTPKSEENSFGN